MEANHLVASFCNLRLHQQSLLSVDLGYGSIQPLGQQLPSPVDTRTGLTSFAGRIYSLSAWNGQHSLTVWSRDAPPTCHRLEGLLNAHSILVRDSYLYVVNTGTDEVVRYLLQGDKPISRQVYWRASASSSDTHHLNSIAEFGGSVVVSAFGPKERALWSSAMDGYIWDIDRDMPVVKNLYHPHSLGCRGDRLLFCESSTSRLCSLSGRVAQLHGYTRGLTWLSDRLVCVASSVGRRISKSTGMIANPADPGEPTGRCQLMIIDLGTGEVQKTIDLSSFGDEIYDLLALDESTISIINEEKRRGTFAPAATDRA